jgi:type III pantothenate kinase
VDLVADLGNTRSHLALFDRGQLVAKAAVPNADAEGEPERGWLAFLRSLEEKPTRLALASVNPAMKLRYVKWASGELGREPLVLGETLRPPIVLDVREPGSVGADRVADAIWAARRLKGRAAIVVDCGTAITLNVVSAQGAFLGGAIAPGLGTQARSLAEKTALLPRIEIASGMKARSKAPAPIGRDTVSCIESGVFWGSVGLVDLLASKMEEELGAKAIVVATGGDAALVASGSRRIERVVPDLTLEGIALALDPS